MLGVRRQSQCVHFFPSSDPDPGEVVLQGLFGNRELDLGRLFGRKKVVAVVK